MAPSHKFKVVICGAGIGGLMTAVALSKYPDIKVEVFEGAAQLAEVGAGIGIFPRPWEIIRRLGLEEELLKLCENKPQKGPVSSLRYRKSDQKEGLDFHTLVTNGSLALFHRADFQKVLLKRLPKSCKIHCSKRLRSYSQRPSGLVELLFEDGSTTTCNVLIGADGLKSAVRRSFMGEKAQSARLRGKLAEAADFKASIEPTWSGTVAYRALIPAERLRAQAPHHPIFSRPTQYLGKDGHIIGYPIARGKFINFGAFVARHDLENTIFDGPWTSTTETSDFSRFFADWESEVQDLLRCVDNPLRWAIHTVRPLRSFVSGRAVLIGDAAHAMTPHQGSGAGQAIEDAYILATILGHPSTTRDTLEKSLTIFDRVRRPLALEVLEKSRRNGQWFSFHDCEFDHLSQRELYDELRSLGETLTKTWEWTWTTSVDESVQEALRMLETRS